MPSYTDHARAWERDPVITPMGLRTEVASGKRGRWGRYNDPSTLVYVGDIAMTRTQANVFDLIRVHANTGVRVTLHSIAGELHVAVSTVYRACVRLAAWGLIAYQSNRGRNGGYMIRMREAKDGLDWFRDEAKARLRAWWKASEDRISRLRGNVASMFPGRERELYEYRYRDSYSSRNRTQHFREWTVEDFREAGLM